MTQLLLQPKEHISFVSRVERKSERSYNATGVLWNSLAVGNSYAKDLIAG